MGFQSNMVNREVCDLIFVDYATKKPFLNLDYANVTTTELTGESVFAYGGKGHPKRVQFSGERGGTLTIETQVQSAKLWQLVTGGDVSKAAKYVVRTELTSEDGSKVTIPAGDTVLANSISVYADGDDCGTQIAHTVDGNEITFTTALTAGAKVIVYYVKETSDKVQRINIKSTSFPKTFTVYGDTVMKTENDEILPCHFVGYKCAPQATMSLSFSNNGEPGSITITCDLMADENDNMLDLILEEE